ncbi:hypothetical protein QQ045_024403 [Rhodiola kirilowii]
MTESMNMKFIGDENYRATMSQLMQGLGDEQRKGNSDLSYYAPKFYELMQARVDPPLEAIWVYSWLSFNCRNFEKVDALERVVAIKDLFHSISACLVSSGAAKSVVGISPVVFELCAFVSEEVGDKDLSSKREKKILKEIVNLSEMILGFVNVSLNASNEEVELNGCIASFPDLARLWMSSDADESGVLKLFLPLASNEVCREVVSSGYNMKQLAGAVTAEAFLMKLSLLFHGGIPRSQLEQEMRNWAIGSISASQYHYFFEVLAKMLLERTLPLNHLSISYDEVLRKVLYDSLILVEYYFLNFKPHPAERMKSLALTRLVMTYEAVEYCRQNGDQRRAALYTDAFSGSKLCSQLKKWMKSLFVVNDDTPQPNGSSPKAILQWLLNIENKGVTVFDDSMAGYRTKVANEIAKANNDEPQSAEDCKKSEGDVFFFDKIGKDMDEGGEIKNNESMSAAFTAAAHKMKDENKGHRRKGKKSKPSKPIKFIKYDVADNSHSDKKTHVMANKVESNSDIEVANGSSDEDVSDIEQ